MLLGVAMVSMRVCLVEPSNREIEIRTSMTDQWFHEEAFTLMSVASNLRITGNTSFESVQQDGMRIPHADSPESVMKNVSIHAMMRESSDVPWQPVQAGASLPG
jgi:hypothetical protein